MDEIRKPESIDANDLGTVRSEIDGWLDEKNWPVPNWWQESSSEAGANKKDFEDYFLQFLRDRYMVVEADFRTILPLYIEMPERIAWNIASVEMIFQLLIATRRTLEETKIDFISASVRLDFLERFIIWIIPRHLLKARAIALKSNVELLGLDNKDLCHQEVEALLEDPILDDSNIADRDFDNIKLSSIRSILDEIIGVCNKKVLDDQISANLQIKRLETLRLWGLLLLGVFILSSPLMINLAVLSDWVDKLWLTHIYAIAWLSALAIILVGTIGGFLSSLINARGSKTSLGAYQEDMIKMQLRPIVGGFVSLIIFILLSWNVIAGVTVKNPGTFLLIAFVSGFSERFFLRLLDLNEEPIQ